MTLSTHVLDASTGQPAVAVRVMLERRGADGLWAQADIGQTGEDGRLRLTQDTPGVYRITFGSGAYFAAQGLSSFYPEVTVSFQVTKPDEHYHVPLLLSPFSYSTYRGELTVSIVLGANQYGKAEIRLLHVTRDSGRHDIRDLNVSVTLSGDLEAAHLTGDNSAVLTTDAQKNTVFAFAQEYGVAEIEDFALRLATHFVRSQPAIDAARVSVWQYPWDRIAATGHSFVRSGRHVRTATASYDGDGARMFSGVGEMTVLNSAGSEFWGFAKDRYTTLKETTDRILATTVNAEWRHRSAVPDRYSWTESYEAALDLLTTAFADTHSNSLQQTLYAMGERVLAGRPEIAEIRLSLPNKHHFGVDVTPFGMSPGAGTGQVFYASDRPYGLIEGTVTRQDTPSQGEL